MIGLVSRLSGNPDTTLVSRAISELRAGRFVVLWEGSSRALVAAAEGFSDEAAGLVGEVSDGRARLVLTASRLRRLGLERSASGAIALPAPHCPIAYRECTTCTRDNRNRHRR